MECSFRNPTDLNLKQKRRPRGLKEKGYEWNIILIVKEVCDSNRTVADPRAEQHEKAHSGLYFTALQRQKDKSDTFTDIRVSC